MNSTRRTFLNAFGLAALGASGGSALAGCSSPLPSADVSAPGFGVDASGTVKLWSRGGPVADAVKVTVDRFHAAQDRIRVEVTPVADAQYVTKLATAIRGDSVPDVADMDLINSSLFIFRDVFNDLTEVVSELPYLDQLSPGHLNLTKKDERFYGVPSISDNSVLWGNTELLDAVGIPLSEAGADLDSLLETIRAISSLGNDTYGWDFPGNASGALAFSIQPHIWAADSYLTVGELGSQRATIEDNDALRSTLAFYRTMWKDGLVSPNNYSEDGATWNGRFLAGKVGMFPSSYGNVPYDAEPEMLEKIAVDLLPGMSAGQQSSFAGGTNMCMPRGCANPSAAWEYMKFALEVEQQVKLPEGGQTPIRGDANTSEYQQSFPLAVTPLEAIDVGYAPPNLAYNLLFNQANGPWLAMFRRAVFDGDIDGAMAEGQRGFERILEQAQL